MPLLARISLRVSTGTTWAACNVPGSPNFPAGTAQAHSISKKGASARPGVMEISIERLVDSGRFMGRRQLVASPSRVALSKVGYLNRLEVADSVEQVVHGRRRQSGAARRTGRRSRSPLGVLGARGD